MVDRVIDYAIFLLTPDGRVASWNAGAERLKLYSASEIIGHNFERFYTPEDRAAGRPRRLLNQALMHGSVEDEGWRVRKDGTLFWANVVITALRNDTGELEGFAKVTRDLTDRRAVEEQLRQSEQRFHTLVASVADYAIFLLSPSGIVQSWNQGGQLLKGYAPHEIIGQSFERFYTPADRAAGRPAHLLDLARAEGRVEDEGWRVRKDGSLFWADVVITALKNEAGELLGFAKVTRDLTARRQAEQDRLKGQAAERAADRMQRLQTATASLASATSVESAARLLVELCVGALQAAGGEVDVVGTSIVAATGSGPTASGDARVAHYVQRIPLMAEARRLGTLTMYFDQARELDADERGLVLALAEVGAQAIDRARLYEAEQAARARAESAVRAQEEFMSVAAHELRTPVSAIKATAQLAERAIGRGAVDPERITRHLHSIERASNRLTALIEDLLDVSRLQTGRLLIRRQRLDLRPLVEEVLERYSGTTPTHQFELHVPETPLVVDADPLRLEQVLDNVLSNAVKYSPRGGLIEVSLWTEGERALLSVTDEGIGVPEGQADQIFDVFGRATNVAEYQIQGLGLGLAICRHLIELHGGRMWAVSPGEDRGTTVTFHVPLARADETAT